MTQENIIYYFLSVQKQLFHGMEDLPGGKLEHDELPIPGLIREIKREKETQIDVHELISIATHEWEGPDMEHSILSIFTVLLLIQIS